jgi:solute carrier family 35 protein E3
MGQMRPENSASQQAVCLLTNLVCSCAIVFANKVVMSTVGFKFAVALTCIHTIATFLTAKALCLAGIITPKKLPKRAVVALASAFTGYIVLCNVSLALNTVGFYQLTKIAIAPTVLIMDALAQRRMPRPKIALCVLVVCLGIGFATVFDTDVMTYFPGMLVGFLSVIVSAQYGVWIGSIAKQHDASPLQLLEQYLPYASAMMAACVPIEILIMGVDTKQTTTLLSFTYSFKAVEIIAISALLGVFVTFSTFLAIGSTSPLTYAVIGHLKTVFILGGGVVIFGDKLTPIKGLGVMLALLGVVAYTLIRLGETVRSQSKGLK